MAGKTALLEYRGGSGAEWLGGIDARRCQREYGGGHYGPTRIHDYLIRLPHVAQTFLPVFWIPKRTQARMPVLLVMEGGHRIYSRGAQRRNVSGGASYNCQRQSRHSQRHRIIR